MTLRRRNDGRGFTVVEIIIVIILFAVIAGAVGQIYRSSVLTDRKLGAKLDLIHRAQLASLHIGKELRQAVEVFAPPTGLSQTRPYLVFSNEFNELKVLYVNDKYELVLQNRNDSDKTEVLAAGVHRLRVFRKGRRLLNYHLFLQDELSGEKFNLISGVCIRNNFN